MRTKAVKRPTRARAPAGDLALRVGARLREQRVARGLSQAQLGAPFYRRQAVSAVERGQAIPSLRALVHMAAMLKTTVRELLPRDL